MSIPEPEPAPVPTLMEVSPYALRAADQLVLGVRSHPDAGRQSGLTTRALVQAAYGAHQFVTISTSMDLDRWYNGRPARWTRLVVPVGTSHLVASYEVGGEALTYELVNPENAPRRYAATITAAEFQALASDLWSEDESVSDDTPRVYSLYRVLDSAPPSTVQQTVRVPELTMLPDLTAPLELVDWQLIDRAGAEGWEPSPAYVELFGGHLGPWLPGTLPARKFVIAAVQAAGWTYWSHKDSGRGPLEVEHAVQYDPPRTEVRSVKAPRARKAVRVEEPVLVRVKRVVSPPATVTGTSFTDAHARLRQLADETLADLADAIAIRPCGHCRGTGLAAPTNTP